MFRKITAYLLLMSLICDDPQSAVVLLKDLLGEEVHLHVSQALESVQK